jgi:RNA polymerase sigma-70 factor (ECF subfamily)
VSKTETIALYQPLLRAIALRIVGSIQDAEDIVQDTFEKWLTIDTSRIQNTKAYLIRSVSNNSLKFINKWKEKAFDKSQEVEEIHVIDEDQSKSIFHFDLDNQMQQAWALLHQKLEPIEKNIFIMREAFNVEYEELQHLYDKKVDNLRKIVSRAKQKLQDEVDKFSHDLPASHVPTGFLNACRTGAISEYMSEWYDDMAKKLPGKK